MKVQLFAAAACTALLLQTCSAESHGGVALKSDAHEGQLRGIVGSFLESTNKARCRQKCEKKEATPLSKCQSYCDDVCGSNVKNAEDKCHKPCDFIDCSSSGDDSKDTDRDNRCDDNDDCKSKQYCKFGKGDCDPDSQGRCTDGGRDELSCTRELKPVCGCDQREYSNECGAENYGVTIDYKDSCDYDARKASDFKGTCRKNKDCNSGYYCKPLFQECSTEDRKGFCTKIPKKKNDCESLPNDKVCTCDGKTEKNECRAEYESQGVDHRGKC